MAELTPIEDITAIPAVPISALPEDEERLRTTLELRIFNIIGKELLAESYKPTTYAMAVIKSGGDPNQVIYHYTKIRYNDLFERATRRLQHSKDIKI